ADLELGRLAGSGEFLEGDAAFALQADVDDGGVAFDGDDAPLEYRTFEVVGLAERLLEKGGEAFLDGASGRSGIRHELNLFLRMPGPVLCPALVLGRPSRLARSCSWISSRAFRFLGLGGRTPRSARVPRAHIG